MGTLNLVEHIQQVEKNLEQYNLELKNGEMTLSPKRVEQWYYIHDSNLFGPSRYIGYTDITIEKYMDADYLDGGETTQRLKKWFDKCEDDILFEKIAEKLVEYLSDFDKDIRRNSNGEPSIKLNLLKTEIPSLKKMYLEENIAINKNNSIQNMTEKSLEKIKTQAILESKENATKVKNKISKVSTTIYNRDSYISQYVKILAKGKCQLCESPAPFNDREGKPYLESHHIEWLSNGGKDTIENCIALCSNCHRKMHILDLKENVNKLKLIASNYPLD